MPAVVARIGKPHGIKGEVTVQVHTDDPAARLTPGHTLDTSAVPGSGVPRELTISTARVHNGTWLLGFAEIPDRTGAEGLRGTLLMLPDVTDPVSSADLSAPDRAPDGADDGWYEDELLGLSVFDPTGTRLGEVCGLETGAAQDRLRIRLLDGHETLVPFVDALVPVVDVQAARVVIDAPGGLLDLGRG
ncbi:MAG: ribosome maturation factor RimM [Nostocoides sp.]